MEVNPVSQRRAEGAQQPGSRNDSAERCETLPASLPDFCSPLLTETGHRRRRPATRRAVTGAWLASLLGRPSGTETSGSRSAPRCLEGMWVQGHQLFSVHVESSGFFKAVRIS